NISGVPAGLIPNVIAGKGAAASVSVDVAMIPGGGFVVVYDVGSLNGKTAEVHADFFQANGTPLGDQTVTSKLILAGSPSVAVDGLGVAHVAFLFAGLPGGQLHVAVEDLKPGSAQPVRVVDMSDPNDVPLT